jgi:hypothetical protein
MEEGKKGGRKKIWRVVRCRKERRNEGKTNRKQTKQEEAGSIVMVKRICWNVCPAYGAEQCEKQKYILACFWRRLVEGGIKYRGVQREKNAKKNKAGGNFRDMHGT